MQGALDGGLTHCIYIAHIYKFFLSRRICVCVCVCVHTFVGLFSYVYRSFFGKLISFSAFMSHLDVCSVGAFATGFFPYIYIDLFLIYVGLF